MKFFKFSEFETNGVKATNDDIKYNIVALVANILDKVREYYGKAIYIEEGLNNTSKYEGHAIGCAAVITTKSKQGNMDVFNYIKTLDYDELRVIGDYTSIQVCYRAKNRHRLIENTNSPCEKFDSEYIVCLESGHGKDVCGKRSPDGRLLEWEWTREIKYRLAEVLESQHVAQCFDINPEDTEPGLSVRANRVNAVYKKNNKKAIFVSIHVNAAGNGEWMNARGWSIWTTKGKTESDNFATVMWEEANKVFSKDGIQMRKDTSDGDNDYEANFTVIYKTLCPSVLVENLFQDSKQDVEYLLSEHGKEACVTAMANGIKKYLSMKK